MSPHSNKAPGIRHCHLYKRSHFDGYGFNLYKKTREELHIIGSLEPGSPGLDGGLRQDDVLIEVNGVNVEKIKHQDVVEKIRELPTQVSLLVIDKKTNSKRKKKFIKISSSDPNVVLIYSEKISPINEEKILEAKNNLKNVSENINLDEKVEGNEGEVEDDSANQVDGNANENDIEDQDDYFSDNNSEINETAEMAMMKIVLDVKEEDGEKQEVDEVDSNEVVADEAEEEILDDELFESPEMSYKTASSTASISSNEKVSPLESASPSSEEDELLSLHLPGSVEEMKAIIDGRKKKDSRIDNKFDLWQKHSIIQAL